MFVSYKPWSIVAKARRSKRPKWKDTRTTKRLESLSLTMQRSISMDLVKGIKTFRKTIPDKEEIYQAWLKRGYGGIVNLINWKEIPNVVAPATKKLNESFVKSSELAVEVLPPPIKDRLRFDYGNPKIQRLFQQRSGEKIVQPLVEGGRQSIQQIVHRQFTQGLSPKMMAGEIKNYIGLYPQLAGAHTNYVLGLLGSGMKESEAERLSNAYYDKLLDYRAMSIARTETHFMVSHGQLEVWKQGQDNGLIPTGAKKVWDADGNPCPDCEDMDGVAVDIDDVWVMNDGTVCDVPSDSHPNCNCTPSIDYGDIENAEFEEPEES